MPRLCFLLGAIFLATSAQAMSLRELRALENSNKQGESYALYYLIGVMEGIVDAHAHSVRAGAKPRFCIDGRRLEPRMAKPLLDAELKRNADLYEADMPVQLVIVNALVNVYTCS
jgi:hypothetical protein